jgi:DNA-binding CsgD family transcriptional regulator
MSELTSSDLRAALRLSGEARELPQGSQQQREHVLRGLAAMVSAQVCVWGELDPGPPMRLIPSLDIGWDGPREREVFLNYIQTAQGTLSDPAVERMGVLQPAPVVTFAREQLVENRSWYRSPHVQELRRAARVDAFLYTGRFDLPRPVAFSMHRAWGDKPFAERDRSLIDAFHAESRWLHAPPPPLVDAALLGELPPRLREVLLALARGHSEKEIAAELRLSQHTVHDYVKALHQRLRVRSRGELLSRVLRK